MIPIRSGHTESPKIRMLGREELCRRAIWSVGVFVRIDGVLEKTVLVISWRINATLIQKKWYYSMLGMSSTKMKCKGGLLAIECCPIPESKELLSTDVPLGFTRVELELLPSPYELPLLLELG